MSAAPTLIGMVVEGPSDARTIPGLVDRVLLHEVPALDLGRARAVHGLDPGAAFLAWHDVDQAVQQRRVPRKHGHFGGQPAIEDARTAWYALQCFVARDPQPAAVILVRDSDGKRDERTRGLAQAREEAVWPFHVVIGVAHTMLECWVIAGFTPETKREKAELAALRKSLGFSPTERSEQLDASDEGAKKSPKRVLRCLTDADREREARCWTDAALELLRDRGQRNGLSAFLVEVTEEVAPIFRG
jgi:hypothetical protein